MTELLETSKAAVVRERPFVDRARDERFDADRTSLADIVRAAQTGDREAFGQLVERFEQVVFATALARLRNYAEAQELTQDVFIQAMEKLEQLRVPEAFPGWLKSITHRMAINRSVRRAPTFSAEPEMLSNTCVDRQTPLGAVLVKEECRQLRDGLARLRPLDRETLEAFYVRGQSLLEMSDEFDAPVGTIKRRLHVARKRLEREVAQIMSA